MPDSDRIIMQMTKITRVAWNFSRDSMAIRTTLGNVLITPNTIDEQENFTIDGYLYLASLLTLRENYFDAWRRDRDSTQWLSWPHIPIVSQGHYKCKIIQTSARLSEQDYSRLRGH